MMGAGIKMEDVVYGIKVQFTRYAPWMETFSLGGLARCTALIPFLLCGCAHLDGNFQRVEGADLYRSGQLTGGRLSEMLRKYPIETVVNLRGERPEESWFQEETEVCEAQGVDYRTFAWSMERMPPPEDLKRLLDLYDNRADAVLVHCQGGSHRAAVASAVILLAEGATVEQARREFKFWFADAPIGRIVEWYESSALPFREWLDREYPALYAEASSAVAARN
jgi:protein tyrosine phosphatase (PTP) superfamily phosphohydrolase (DUF442 family)